MEDTDLVARVLKEVAGARSAIAASYLRLWRLEAPAPTDPAVPERITGDDTGLTSTGGARSAARQTNAGTRPARTKSPPSWFSPTCVAAFHLARSLPAAVATAACAHLYTHRARALAREGRPAATWQLTAFATGVVLAAVVRTWAAGRARRQPADRPRGPTHPDRRPRHPTDRPRAWFLALLGNRLPDKLHAGLDALDGRRRSGWGAAGRGLAPSTEQPGPRRASGATTRSIVQLPADARWEFEVYVNGVQQEPGVDFYLDGRDLIFDRPLRRDRVSRRPWRPGARGVGTCRQDDIVDIRYETYGEIQFEHAAAITFDDDHEHR